MRRCGRRGVDFLSSSRIATLIDRPLTVVIAAPIPSCRGVYTILNLEQMLCGKE